MASEFGRCPNCDVPLVLTCELRALTDEDLEKEMRRQNQAEDARRNLPLY